MKEEREKKTGSIIAHESSRLTIMLGHADITYFPHCVLWGRKEEMRHGGLVLFPSSRIIIPPSQSSIKTRRDHRGRPYLTERPDFQCPTESSLFCISFNMHSAACFLRLFLMIAIRHTSLLWHLISFVSVLGSPFKS